MAETEDLKSFQYRFESDRGHQFARKAFTFALNPFTLAEILSGEAWH